MNQLQTTFATNGLVRPRQDRLLAGVCSGIGRRFGVDAWLVRVLFVLACIVLPGSQLIVYPILWVLMPAGAPGGGPADGDRRAGAGIPCRPATLTQVR